MQLTQSVWETPAFQKFAEEQLVLLQADFPRKKKNRLPDAQSSHNAQLAATYNPEGQFPHIVLLNPDATVRSRPNPYLRDAEEMIQHLRASLLEP